MSLNRCHCCCPFWQVSLWSDWLIIAMTRMAGRITLLWIMQMPASGILRQCASPRLELPAGIDCRVISSSLDMP